MIDPLTPAKTSKLDLSSVDKTWTLFLDRDGVINHEKTDYVYNYDEFVFYEGVLEAFKIFRFMFGRTLVMTNQRGVGRELMTEADLQLIHKSMVADIALAGGKIDGIYYCTSTDNADPNRKPNPGMAMQAFKDYEAIVPEKTIMVGNNLSDMEFGRNAGIRTVLLTTTGTKVRLPHPLVDLQFDMLRDFAGALPMLK
jgi:D-glycero-D-manno-heptose 1,7-bisphosphate phosphatase